MKKKKKNKVVRLPNKLSALIRVALKDLIAVEKSEHYVINMGVWHNPGSKNSEKVCFVCFAGGVMANRLKVPRNKPFIPDHRWFTPSQVRKLKALNYLRRGEVSNAYAALTDDWSFHGQNISITEYKISPELFKADMAALANKLEEAGL